MPSFARILVPLLLALGLTACAGEPPKNLLFLVSDALRADAMSCYGGRAQTPNLCALADEGVLFERAYANAPWTLPSVVAMFTGTYPLQHRRTMQGRAGEPLPFYFLDQGEHLLGEALTERGFEVTAVLENSVTRQPQVLQGFTILNRLRATAGPPPVYAIDEEVARYGLATWESGYKPISQSIARLLDVAQRPFLHLHWIDDPHAPYRPPDYLRAEAAREAGELPRDAAFYHGLGHQNKGTRRHLRGVASTLTPAEVAFIERLYELEIESVDRRVGALLRALEATGQREHTLIVFTSDHGEEFGEHGGFLHDHAMWDELIRIPLIVAGPGVRRGHRVRQPVSHVDLVPTLADLFELEGLGPFQGESLRPVLRGRRREPTSRYHYVSSTITHDAEAMIHDRYKLIAATDGSSAALYDLEADPLEQTDLAPGRAAVVAKMRQAIEAVHAENQSAWEERYQRDHPELRDEAAKETEKNLRDLGYLN
jgi:arylsulfatase A-like enzyme